VKFFERRSARWWAISVTAHVFMIAALAQIAFKYPLGQLLGIVRPAVEAERLQYISLPSQPTQHSGGARAATTESSAPAALRAPVAVPTTTPPISPVDTSRAQAAGGTGAGLVASGGDAGYATGVVPRQPDPRIALQPGAIVRTPRTVAEDVDSIMNLAIGIYVDSASKAAKQRKPGDWTITGKDGEKWGLDEHFIHLGKFKLPSAILAMLPLNKGGGSPIEARTAAYIRRDVLENAQRAISEDEFRAAVKRIRERKEREKQQKVLAADTKSEPPKQQ
jgi:hypothetical protein